MQDGLEGTIRGPALLALVSFLWGTSFPLIKMIVSSIGAGEYVAWRYGISVAILAPYYVYRIVKIGPESKSSIKSGALLGLLYFGGIWLQGLGTEYTSASNSGFITSLYIPIVYVIEVAYNRSTYSRRFSLAAFLSVIGMYLVSGGSYQSRMGDLIVLAGSLFWALHVLAVYRFARQYSTLDLVFVQYMVTAFLGFLVAPRSLTDLCDLSNNLLIIFYLAAVCSLLVGALQVIGQKNMTAHQAALIFALEPVFAALFSYLLIDERLDTIEYLGASLILISVVISLGEIARYRQRR